MDRQPLSAGVSSSTSTSSVPPDSTHFLPRFVPELTRTSSQSVYQADLAYNYGTNPPIYDIHINWRSNSKEANEIYDKLFAGKEKTLGGMVACDGMCGKQVEEEGVVQFGECEHNICPRCMSEAKCKVFMVDGSPGCCNEDCIRELTRRSRSSTSLRTSQKTSQKTSQRSPSSSSVSSSVSQKSFTPSDNLIHLKIYHFFLEEDKVSRKLFTYEMKGSSSFSRLKKDLSGFIPLLSNSSIFYTAKEAIRRQGLIPLPKVKQNLEMLSEGKDHLIVVVTAPGVTI